MSGRPELLRRIHDEIERSGPMRFDRFMEMALYEPGLGYYASIPSVGDGDLGALADFQTSPQVHPAFGHLVARYLLRVWNALDRPEPLVIVEPGAGGGELAGQILDGLMVDGGPLRVEYHAVDARPSPPPMEGGGEVAGGEAVGEGAAVRLGGGACLLPVPGRVQQGDGQETNSLPTPDPSPCPTVPTFETLGGGRGSDASATAITAGEARHNAKLRWWRSLDNVRRAGVHPHCIVSNEFFDALPVHRVAWLNGGLKEIYVDRGERGFVERIGDPSDDALARWILDGGIVPSEGWRGEICLRLMSAVEAISAIVDRGVVLSIDYGYETAELFDPRHAGGTLLAYFRHQWNEDLLERVGEQDLTSHVDFGALTRFGRQTGLEPWLLTTQRDFLLKLGLSQEVERWVAREPTAGRRWQARLRLSELIRPDGLGRLKVLAQARGLGTTSGLI